MAKLNLPTYNRKLRVAGRSKSDRQHQPYFSTNCRCNTSNASENHLMDDDPVPSTEDGSRRLRAWFTATVYWTQEAKQIEQVVSDNGAVS